VSATGWGPTLINTFVGIANIKYGFERKFEIFEQKLGSFEQRIGTFEQKIEILNEES